MLLDKASPSPAPPCKKSKSAVKETQVYHCREEEIASLSDDHVALLLEQKQAALGRACQTRRAARGLLIQKEYLNIYSQ